MIKHIFEIFKRDLKVNSRDFMALYMMVFPILLAIVLNIFAPGINDTTINIALLEQETTQIEYFEQFAKIETFADEDTLKERVARRDHIVGILSDDQGAYLVVQGNEPEMVVDYAILLKSLYELDAQVEDTTAEIIEFGMDVPPLKKSFINIIMLMSTIIAGMLIALNIIEEKADRTIRAINVTPVKRLTFVLGKSMTGIITPIVGCTGAVYIAGFRDVHIGQLILLILVCTLISVLIGFIQGLNSDDIMGAISGIKMLMMPMIASTLAVEFLSEKWQVLFYWSPFYWAYRGNEAVLSYNATWLQIVGYTAIVGVITTLVFIALVPKLKKGLY